MKARDSSRDLGRTTALRRRLKACWKFDAMVGGPLALEEVRQLAAVFLEELPGRVPAQPLLSELASLVGSPLSDETLDTLQWRIAGNLARLREGETIPAGVREPEWMPVQFVDFRETPGRLVGRKHQIAVELTYRVLAGCLCPSLHRFVWTTNFASYFASKLGFGRRGSAMEFVTTRQLISLRASLLFTPEQSERQPGFDGVKVQPAMLKRNRELIKRRSRRLTDCPQGYTHECHKCWVGYNDCPMGCWPRTLIKQLCLSCQVEARHAPGDDYCVECERAKRLSPQ